MVQMHQLNLSKSILLAVIFFACNIAHSSLLSINGSFQDKPRTYLDQAEGLNINHRAREYLGNNFNGLKKITIGLDISEATLSPEGYEPFINSVSLSTSLNEDFMTFSCTLIDGCLDAVWKTGKLEDRERGPFRMAPFNVYGTNSPSVVNNASQGLLNLDIFFHAFEGVEYYIFFNIIGSAPDYNIRVSSVSAVPLPASLWLFLLGIAYLKMFRFNRYKS